ncbi:MAG: NHL repeat-containing protein [bacterium]|nr:NHL repeat-containing protein [bacterium]
MGVENLRTYRVLIWTFVFVAFLGGLGALFWYYTQNELPPSFERTIGTGAAGQGPGELNEPTGVGVDGSGNVYVLDTRNCRVQRFDPQGKLIDVWGSQGSGDAQMREPIRLKLAPDNTVWVADTGNSRLLHFSTQGEYLGEVGSLGQDEGQFVAPIGIAFDSEGYMWVSDARSNRLQLFSPKGEFRSALENNGSLNFNQPWGLDINGNDEIIVANTNANQILKFNAEGELIQKWGLGGKGPGEFDRPTDVLVMYDGCILVSDTGNNRIQKFDSQGKYMTEWGTGGSENTALHRPQQIAEGQGQLFYVADAGANRIQVIHQRDTIHLYGPKPAPYPTSRQKSGGSILDEFSTASPGDKSTANGDSDNLRDSAAKKVSKDKKAAPNTSAGGAGKKTGKDGKASGDKAKKAKAKEDVTDTL